MIGSGRVTIGEDITIVHGVVTDPGCRHDRSGRTPTAAFLSFLAARCVARCVRHRFGTGLLATRAFPRSGKTLSHQVLPGCRWSAAGERTISPQRAQAYNGAPFGASCGAPFSFIHPDIGSEIWDSIESLRRSPVPIRPGRIVGLQVEPQ